MAQSFLVVGPRWIGDMVLAQSLMMALQARHPGAAVDVVAPPSSLRICERMPEVRDAIPLPVPPGRMDFAARWRLGRSLRGRYDRAFVLPPAWKAALVPAIASVPVRTGVPTEGRWGLINDPREAIGSRIEQFAGLLGEGAPSPRLRVDHARQGRRRRELGLAGRLAMVCPGSAFGPSKRWPAERFGAVAAALIARGYTVGVLGSPNEAPLAEQVRAVAPEAVDLCGPTDLNDAVDLLAAAELAVTNDSGLMHVAAAVGTRLVSLFGPTPTSLSPPTTPDATLVELEMPCRPCIRPVCPLGHRACLDAIAIEDVVAAL